jgi:hypothetical protein
MAALTKILLTPYFGDLPEWFDSFRPPKGYAWMLDTDLTKFKKRVKDKLGIDYPGIYGNPKVWDYRCALGLLYEDEIKDFDYWGTMDFDMVFGDMNQFLPDSELSRLDVYSGHNEYVCGCFSLYRNVPAVNELFKNYPGWEVEMFRPEATGWVEQQYSRILEISGLNYAYTFHQGNPWTKEPVLKKEGDKLFQLIEWKWVEIMFFHFRHSKKWPLTT